MTTNILIVDDEAPIRNMIRTMINNADYEIYEAENGNEAFDICKSNNIDLVITDLVMPNKNGLELMLMLKDNFPDMRIIAISGGGGISGQFEYLTIAQLLNIKSVIKKPFTKKEMVEHVQQALI